MRSRTARWGLRTARTPVHRYLRTLVDRIADDELDPSSVITHTLPLDQAPTALEMFEHRRGERIKVVLEP